MASVLSLALKLSADTSAVKLGPVERALQQLGQETEKVAGVFDKFTDSSEVAVRAQENTRAAIEQLTEQRRAGTITAQQFADQFAVIAQAARDEAAALERASQITDQNRTAFERFTSTQAELTAQLDAGRISQETYDRAIEAAAKSLTDAERATAGLAERNRDAELAAAAAAESQAALAAATREAASITASVVTEEERREARLSRLRELLDQNLISEETYQRAIAEASGANEAATRAEAERQRVLEQGRQVAARFATADERRSEQLAELSRLLAAGAISEETFARAAREASGANQAAAQAERDRNAALAEANRIIQQNLTPQERYTQQVGQLRSQLASGLISQETFNRALEKSQQEFRRARDEAARNERTLASLSRQLTTIARIQVARFLIDGFRAVLSVVRRVTSQITSLVRSVTQLADRAAKLAVQTGISAERLQALGVAAELSGTSLDTVVANTTRLQVTISRLADSGKIGVFRRLGIDFQELQRLSPDEQFRRVGEAISGIADPAERARIAVELFGRAGAQLLPLFASNIREVEERAQRLGIILSTDQTAAIEQVNDTFTLVRRTVEGIIGQVAGNLAPVVTKIGEEFLQFVETFSAFSASGGTAVADAITDTLLRGAEVLAGVFDRAVERFRGFSVTLEQVGETFSVATAVLQTVVNAAQALFNLGQSIVSAITLGVGKVLEQLGRIPFFSDLREAGRALADSAFEQLEKNADQFKDAVDRSFASAGTVIFGETPEEAGQRGRGAAEEFISNFRNDVERARQPEVKVATDIDRTTERLATFLEQAGDGADEFLRQSQETLAVFQQQAEAGELTAQQIQIMTGFMEKVNAQLAEEERRRNEVLELARKQAQADEERVDRLLKARQETDKFANDIEAVQREIGRTISAIVAGEAGEGASARLSELLELQRELEDAQAAAAQGFTDGYAKAFEATNSRFSKLIERSGEFGQAGFDAALRLQEGIARAQEQAAAGILSAEAYQAEVRRQEELYQKQIEDLKKLADERLRVNKFVDEQLELARFNGDTQRLAAAKNVASLEAEIGRVQDEIAAARRSGDQEAVRAGIQRLAQLDQVAARERDIASGRLEAEAEIAKSREEFLKKQADNERRQQEQIQEFARQREAEFSRQADRIRGLLSIGQQTIESSDIRTTQGAAQVQRLAANAFDPRLAEQRRQTKILNEINVNTARVASANVALALQRVRILGGVG